MSSDKTGENSGQLNTLQCAPSKLGCLWTYATERSKQATERRVAKAGRFENDKVPKFLFLSDYIPYHCLIDRCAPFIVMAIDYRLPVYLNVGIGGGGA